jgi:hypothetical protein
VNAADPLARCRLPCAADKGDVVDGYDDDPEKIEQSTNERGVLDIHVHSQNQNKSDADAGHKRGRPYDEEVDKVSQKSHPETGVLDVANRSDGAARGDRWSVCHRPAVLDPAHVPTAATAARYTQSRDAAQLCPLGGADLGDEHRGTNRALRNHLPHSLTAVRAERLAVAVHVPGILVRGRPRLAAAMCRLRIIPPGIRHQRPRTPDTPCAQ